LLATYAASEDLVRIGAYQKGTDPALDQALAVLPELNGFLQQGPGDSVSLEENVVKLLAVKA